MKERFFDNFKMHFPITAKLTESYRKTGLYDLTVKLSDGTSVLYDDMQHSIRRLPKDCLKMTETECRREFGMRLRNLMFLKSITQTDLSEKTGISQTTISGYLNGKGTPSFYNVDKIAKALKCSTDDFRYID